MILFECLLWGVGNPISKIGMQHMPAFWCIGLRFALSFVVFILIFGKRVKAHFPRGNALCWLSICVFNGLAFIFANLALDNTGATVASFLMAISVVFTPLTSRLLLGHKSGLKTYCCILVVLAGLFFLCGNDGEFTFGKGEIFALLCSACLGLSLTLTSKYIEFIDPIFLATAQSGVAAVLSIAGALIFRSPLTAASFDLPAIGTILYTALACTVAAYLLQNTAMRHISAVFASVVFCSEPVFTAIASFFMLKERLSLRGVLGAVLIIAGVVLASFLQMKESNEIPPEAE